MPEAKIDVQYRSHRPVALAPLPAPAVIVPPFILLEEPKPPTRAQREVCMPQLEGFWTRNVNTALAERKFCLGLCLQPRLPRV